MLCEATELMTTFGPLCNCRKKSVVHDIDLDVEICLPICISYVLYTYIYIVDIHMYVHIYIYRQVDKLQ